MTAPRTSRPTSPRTSLTALPVTPPSLWDPIVRLTHWGIALVVVLNALVSDGGSLFHVTLGWLAMALLVMRLIWGVLGTAEARFSAFPPNPAAALRHLRQLSSGRVKPHPSHNPAAALMVYAFWLALTVVIGSGLYLTGGATPMQVANDKAAVASGDWSALITEGEDDASDDERGLRHTAEEIHEVAANLLLILAALHVAGVVLESRAMRRNLLAPMLLGNRRK
jgi:cytochrome b